MAKKARPTTSYPILTNEEKSVIIHLAEAWNEFNRMERLHPDEQEEFRHAIHVAQKEVMARPVQREFNEDHPLHPRRREQRMSCKRCGSSVDSLGLCMNVICPLYSASQTDVYWDRVTEIEEVGDQWCVDLLEAHLDDEECEEAECDWLREELNKKRRTIRKLHAEIKARDFLLDEIHKISAPDPKESTDASDSDDPGEPPTGHSTIGESRTARGC